MGEHCIMIDALQGQQGYPGNPGSPGDQGRPVSQHGSMDSILCSWYVICETQFLMYVHRALVVLQDQWENLELTDSA